MTNDTPQQTWIILGASSTIAKAFTRSVAEKGAHVILAGRRMDDLNASADDARARGAMAATPVIFDARVPDTFQAIIDSASAEAGTINCAVFVGSMPSQDDIDAKPELVDGTIADSFTGPARFLQMSYCQIWCLRAVGHAAIWSWFVASIPSLNVTPVMTLAR